MTAGFPQRVFRTMRKFGPGATLQTSALPAKSGRFWDRPDNWGNPHATAAAADPPFLLAWARGSLSTISVVCSLIFSRLETRKPILYLLPSIQVFRSGDRT